MRILVLCLLTHLAAASLALTAEPPTAVPADGPPTAAAISAVDAAWNVTFQNGEKTRTCSAADLAWWGRGVEIQGGSLVILNDGSVLVADVLDADKERLRADSSLFGLVELPLELAAGVVFQAPVDRHSQDQLLDQVASARGEVDRVMLVNGDQITGRMDSIRDNTVRIETDVGTVDVKAERIRAVAFNPALLRRPSATGLRAIAGFSDGSRLVGQQLVVDQASLRLILPGGQTLRTQPQELVLLQPLGGRVVYLSDLAAAGYRHVPFLNLSWPYRTDRNVTDGMLRCDGGLYLKGLGMHSAARLTYLLHKPYQRFQAELGIDDSTEGLGSVRVRVFVDGRERYTSPTVRGGQPPVPVAVDLAGAKRLDLLVEYADRADELDRADWLNARLIK